MDQSFYQVLEEKFFILPNYLDPKTGFIHTESIITVTNGIVENIQRLENQSKTDIPKDSIRLPSNQWYLPGLIDAHVHITSYFGKDNDFESAFNHVKQNLELTLFSGFTTIRDMHGNHRMLNRIRQDLNRELISGPRVVCAGKAIQPVNVEKKEFKDWLERKLDLPFEWTKIMNEVSSKDNATPVIDSKQIAYIIQESHKKNKPVAIHSHEPSCIEYAVKNNCDSLEHYTYLSECDQELINEIKRKQIPVVSNLWLPEYYLNNKEKFKDYNQEDWDFFQSCLQHLPNSVQIAYDNDLNMVFGTDAIAGMHGKNYYEFTLLHKQGIPSLKCIQMATIQAGKLLNMPIGEIKKGYYFDVIGVKKNGKNPIRNIFNKIKTGQVETIIKNGNIYQY
jgi:imidazolonepropionase-like amidohydrolase